MVPAFETRNSVMPARNNEYAAAFAAWSGKMAVGGSDSHSMASLGTAYTEVPQARGREEFFGGLRSGRGLVHGDSGGYLKLTRDVFLIVGACIEEKPWAAALLPLALAVPFVTLGNYLREVAFGRYWMMHLERERALAAITTLSNRGPQTEPAL